MKQLVYPCFYVRFIIFIECFYFYDTCYNDCSAAKTGGDIRFSMRPLNQFASYTEELKWKRTIKLCKYILNFLLDFLLSLIGYSLLSRFLWSV